MARIFVVVWYTTNNKRKSKLFTSLSDATEYANKHKGATVKYK